jgi:hypothetical protein
VGSGQIAIRFGLAGGGGAEIIYSAAVGRRSAPHAGAVSPHYLLPKVLSE